MIAKLVELADVDVCFEMPPTRHKELVHFDKVQADLGRSWFGIDECNGRPYVDEMDCRRIYLSDKYRNVKSMDELQKALIADGIDANYTNLKDPDTELDYKALCWKLVDKMNDAWRKKTGKSGCYCSFEFNHANAYYMYSSGFVAQIVVVTKLSGLVAIAASDIGGIVTKGCETPEEAFKSMIENYLKKVNDNGWFGELDAFELPKTIEEIAA